MGANSPSWDDLRIFLHVGRGGSLTAAAHSLSLSHTTAYRRLQKLEQDLGVRLFERTRAGYTLTAAGEELARVAAEMERNLLSTTRSLSQREAWPGGVVKITSVDTLMHHVLPPIMAEYQRSANVQLQLDTSIGLLDIAKGEADVAIRAGGKPPEPLVGWRLCRLETTVYQPIEWPKVDLDTLSQHPWISLDGRFAHLDSSRWLRQQGLDKRAVLHTNSHVNLLRLLLEGMGMGVLPCHLGDREPSLRRVMPPPKGWRSDLWLLTRPELRQVPRIRQLIEAVRQGFLPHVALFEGQRPQADLDKGWEPVKKIVDFQDAHLWHSPCNGSDSELSLPSRERAGERGQ